MEGRKTKKKVSRVSENDKAQRQMSDEDKLRDTGNEAFYSEITGVGRSKKGTEDDWT